MQKAGLSLDEAVSKYTPLVRRTVSRRKYPDPAEALSRGLYAIWRAWESYDPSQGASLRGHIWRNLRLAMSRELASQRKAVEHESLIRSVDDLEAHEEPAAPVPDSEPRLCEEVRERLDAMSEGDRALADYIMRGGLREHYHTEGGSSRRDTYRRLARIREALSDLGHLWPMPEPEGDEGDSEEVAA